MASLRPNAPTEELHVLDLSPSAILDLGHVCRAENLPVKFYVVECEGSVRCRVLARERSTLDYVLHAFAKYGHQFNYQFAL